jgi:hypothetical protein
VRLKEVGNSASTKIAAKLENEAISVVLLRFNRPVKEQLAAVAAGSVYIALQSVHILVGVHSDSCRLWAATPPTSAIDILFSFNPDVTVGDTSIYSSKSSVYSDGTFSVNSYTMIFDPSPAS